MKAEDSLQIAVMSYIRLQYPDVLACHIANERKTSLRQGALLKKKGVLAGMPDVMIFRKSATALGLSIELKSGKNKQTDSQKQVGDKLISEGWEYFVAYDFDTARNIIDQYLKA